MTFTECQESIAKCEEQIAYWQEERARFLARLLRLTREATGKTPEEWATTTGQRLADVQASENEERAVSMVRAQYARGRHPLPL